MAKQNKTEWETTQTFIKRRMDKQTLVMAFDSAVEKRPLRHAVS